MKDQRKKRLQNWRRREGHLAEQAVDVGKLCVTYINKKISAQQNILSIYMTPEVTFMKEMYEDQQVICC